MVGPVTIPKVGTSWHDMYESIGLHDSPLALLKCEENCSSIGACLHDMVAERVFF